MEHRCRGRDLAVADAKMAGCVSERAGDPADLGFADQRFADARAGDEVAVELHRRTDRPRADIGADMGTERDVEQWADYQIKNHDFSRESVVTHMRDEYSTFGWVMERMLTDVGFTLVSADYHAPMHGTYLLRKPRAGEQG